jgi:hypothetical protein
MNMKDFPKIGEAQYAMKAFGEAFSHGNDEIIQDNTVRLLDATVDMILQIPGVYDAVLVAALKYYSQCELKELHNRGIALAADIPGAFIRQIIIQGE